MKSLYQIDYIRALFNYAMDRNKEDNPNEELLDTKDVHLFSFYEHLISDEEVDRYVERYQDLINEQNRTGLKAFGIVATSDNPSFINLKSATIVPFEYQCTIRVKLKDRDIMLNTLYMLIDYCKGMKYDIALLDNGQLFPVETIEDTLYNRCFCFFDDDEPSTYGGKVLNTLNNGDIVFTEENDKLVCYEKIVEESNYTYYSKKDGVVPTHNSFKKMKISLSCDDIKCNEPYTLNGEEYCELAFSGSATLTTHNVRLGNDLIWTKIKKNYVKIGENNYHYFTGDLNSYEYLEPMEMPSSASANTQALMLKSFNMMSGTHTDSVSNTLQYTFIYDRNSNLLNQWYMYGRYGIKAEVVTDETKITPNIVYTINEIWASWGEIEIIPLQAKLVSSVEVENTETDVLTLQVTMQIISGE